MNYDYFHIDINATQAEVELKSMIDTLLQHTFHPYEIASRKEFDKDMDRYFNQMNNGRETIIYEINRYKNSLWRYEINIQFYPEKPKKYGQYPDFKLAELFYNNFGWNCICSRNDLFADIDDNQPWTGVCLIDGIWYVCDCYSFYQHEDNEEDTDGKITIHGKLGDIGHQFEKRGFNYKELKDSK